MSSPLEKRHARLLAQVKGQNPPGFVWTVERDAPRKVFLRVRYKGLLVVNVTPRQARLILAFNGIRLNP